MSLCFESFADDEVKEKWDDKMDAFEARRSAVGSGRDTQSITSSA